MLKFNALLELSLAPFSFLHLGHEKTVETLFLSVLVSIRTSNRPEVATIQPLYSSEEEESGRALL